MDAQLQGLAWIGTSSLRGQRLRSQTPEEVAREFESLFLQQLLSVLRPVRNEGDEEGILGGAGEDVYGGMMEQALAEALAAGGGIGLAEPILRFLQSLRADSDGKPQSELPRLTAEEVGRRLADELRDARVTSLPGLRSDPFSGEERFHRGVDLGLPPGSPVNAVTSGRVVFAGRQGAYGNTVLIVGPSGDSVRYAHLDEIRVKEGDVVGRGDVVGTVGTTGRSTGPHLHLEMKTAGRLVELEG